MAPFTVQHSNGKIGVNGIRIIETIISGGLVSAVVLYGVIQVLQEQVGSMGKMIEVHIIADTVRQEKLDIRYLEQQERIIRHETLLRQTLPK